MSGANRYIESRILSADPVELVCLFYENALLALEEARNCLAKKDIAGRSRAISRAIAIVGELEGSLNHEVGGEVSSNLARLYRYMRDRLVTANIKQDAAPLVEVESLLTNMGEAWEQIRPKAGSDSMAPNSRSAGGAWTGPGGGEDVGAYAAHGWSV